MRRHRIIKKVMLSAAVVLAGGSVLGSGCINTLASINLCGTVFTFCTPVDQLNLLFPLLELPDFDADPSCTIPLGCGTTDLLPPIGGDEGGGPGGEGSEQPIDDQGGGLGGGGGGGGV